MTTDTPEDRAQRAANAVADLLNFDGPAEYPPVYDGSQTGFPTQAYLPIRVDAVSRDGQYVHVHFQSTMPGSNIGLPGPEFTVPFRDLKDFDWEPVIPEPDLPQPTLPSDDPPTGGSDGDDDGSDDGDGGVSGSDPEPVGGDDQG